MIEKNTRVLKLGFLKRSKKKSDLLCFLKYEKGQSSPIIYHPYHTNL